MQFIGEHLKVERIKRKFNLEKVSKELNISKNIIEAIERNDFTQDIDKIYLIGHIRSYARFLNIDEKEIIENFKIQTSYDKDNQIKEISKPINSNSFFSFPKGLSFISIIFIATSFYILFIKKNDLYPNYAMTPDVPENLQYELEETQMNIALINNSKNEELKLLKNINNAEKELLIPKAENLKNVSSAIASLPNQDIKNINKDIVLSFLQPTWIQLRDSKNKIIFSKLMNQDDEFSYNFSENLMLTSGNAGNIILSIAGKTLGKIGKSGQVIDSLIIDSNFKN